MQCSGVSVERFSTYVRVGFPAEVDLNNVAGIGRRILQVLDSGSPTVILDLGATTYCGADGVNLIACVHNRAHAVGANVALVVRAGTGVSRVLAICGLYGLIPIAGTVLDAYAAAHIDRMT